MSISTEVKELLKSHPEMLLVSRFPPILEGFLIVAENFNANSKNFVKIKLIVPSLPSLQHMTICVKNLEFLSSIDFIKSTLNLLRSGTCICSFLKQLKQILACETECAIYYDVRTSDHVSTTYETISNRLQDLRDLLLKYLEIQILSSYNLNTIKLMTNGVSTIVQKDQGNLWKIVYSEVPSISGRHSRLLLSHVCYLLIAQIDEFDVIWAQFKEIDMHCWVIDPENPKPYHLYRRIYLTQSLSVLITVDPHFPVGFPNIQFLGSESTISQFRKKLSDIAQKWNSDCTLLQNLSALLDINQFPPEPAFRNVKAEEGLLVDEECCICFLKEFDGGQLPNILCNNGKCNKHYHLSCLQKWLETNGSQPVFDQIHGKCLHCNENISCKL